MRGSELKKRLSKIADCKNRNDVIIWVKRAWQMTDIETTRTAMVKIFDKKTKQFVASKYDWLTIFIQDIYDGERA